MFDMSDRLDLIKWVLLNHPTGYPSLIAREDIEWLIRELTDTQWERASAERRLTTFRNLYERAEGRLANIYQHAVHPNDALLAQPNTQSNRRGPCPSDSTDTSSTTFTETRPSTPATSTTPDSKS